MMLLDAADITRRITVMWKYTGRTPPPYAETPGSGQESVWDYPRPPKLVADERRIIVRNGKIVIADSSATCHVLETAGPPTFYIPPENVRLDLLQPFPGSSICEWKGAEKYWARKIPVRAQEVVGWSYPSTEPPYESISGYLSFYPGRLECYVDDERVRPQPGHFYGGWVTDEIVGPWKGARGTERRWSDSEIISKHSYLLKKHVGEIDEQ